MDVNDPLARLLRLRGTLAESLPTGEVQPFDAEALAGAYARIRATARGIASDLGAALGEFDNQFPESAGEPEDATAGHEVVSATMRNHTVASTAATLLRQLGGYAGGLIETIALSQNIKKEQVEAAREAARPPLGFQ